MSGGFFRGTSADQDTRFSNKQAKLMKSQKFAPELDHLVDMTKVKMDVIKPWIANRVTELLGFEDEVLINFIYGLLDGKEVNGKEIQISLTGFMEKNTGKFMKELWTLLLSAQKNASGVPQQFLDAKEEETRKKKVEADRIANEIQMKKEREIREFDQERSKKTDGAVEMKANGAALDSNSKTMLAKSSFHPEDEKEASERNGVRGRNRVSRSPRSASHSPSPRRGLPSRPISKSHSNSRSPDDRHKSRSLSRSPVARRRSVDRMRYSPRRRSITPRKRHSPQISRSPLRRRSSYFRRRSRSRSVRRSPSRPRRKSPSPVRHRRLPSPVRRRRSPSPARRRRSPSPIRRRRSPSPARRRRSPSPARRRRSPSPVRRRRSPSPVRRRRRSPSPVRRRRSPSPMRHRGSPPQRRRGSPLPIRRGSLSPVRRGSLSPLKRGSPSSMQHSSPSPTRQGSLSPKTRVSHSPVQHQYQRSPLTPQDSSPSPIQHRSPLPGRMRSPITQRRRSPTPDGSSSPSSTHRRTSSPVRKKSASHSRRSPVHSPREKNRIYEKSLVAHRSSSSLRSPHRDSKDRKDIRNKVSTFSPSPERSPTVSKSPPQVTKKRSTSEDRRSCSPNESPVRQTRDRVHDDDRSSPLKTRERRPHQDGQETHKEHKEANHAREDVEHKTVPLPRRSVHSSSTSKQKDSPAKFCIEEEYSLQRSVGGHHATESQSHHDSMDSRNDQGLKSERLSQRGGHPGTSAHQRSPTLKNSLLGDRQMSSNPGESQKSDERNHSRSDNGKESNRQRKSENATMAVERVDHNKRNAAIDSSSEESDRHRTGNREKRKHKKHGREEVASGDDFSYDSEIERKETKRRRKEEKKLRKEKRRDERRRRREERRAEKLKLKSQSDADASDGEHVSRRESHLSDNEETESDQKKLEIELRNRALESMKAKKTNNH